MRDFCAQLILFKIEIIQAHSLNTAVLHLKNVQNSEFRDPPPNQKMSTGQDGPLSQERKMHLSLSNIKQSIHYLCQPSSGNNLVL